MKPIRIHTVCFGEHYWNCLEKGLVPSLLWNNNHQFLLATKAKWSIFVKRSDGDKARELCSLVLPKEQVEVIEYLPENMRFESQDRGTILLDCLNQTAERCIEEQSSMLMALPDFIFGEGSIHALAKWNYGNNCVCVPHVRVNPTILTEVTATPLNNIDLVTMAFGKHLHRSWRDCEVGPFQLGSYISGVSWRHMPGDIIAVQHRLPSVALANFKKEDIEYFNRWNGSQGPSFGRYDWNWPSECLIGMMLGKEDGSETTAKEFFDGEQRLRVIASSDIAFWVEITVADQNCPQRYSPNDKEPDVFALESIHTKVNRMIISSFRHDGSIL